MTTVNIKFLNAHTEQIVKTITFNSRKRSFNAMLPFYNKQQDKWIIGKQYSYFMCGDNYVFGYAGFTVAEADNLAIQAYNQACATLGLEPA
jgi:hypothetical protein